MNYSEVLIGPLRAGGTEAAGKVDAMFATAIHAEKRWQEDVRLESFDEDVVRAHAGLHPDEGSRPGR